MSKSKFSAARRQIAALSEALERFREGGRLPTIKTWFPACEDLLLRAGLRPNVDIYVPDPGARDPVKVGIARTRFNQRLRYKQERLRTGKYKSKEDRELENLRDTPELKKRMAALVRQLEAEESLSNPTNSCPTDEQGLEKDKS